MLSETEIQTIIPLIPILHMGYKLKRRGDGFVLERGADVIQLHRDTGTLECEEEEGQKLLEELERLIRPVADREGDVEEEETDLVRVLRDIEKKDGGVNLVERMTEYFTKEKEEVQGEAEAEASTSAKRQKRTDVLSFGDLSMDEMMDENGKFYFLAEGRTGKSEDEKDKESPKAEVVESDGDYEGLPGLMSESDDEKPRSRNNTANRWRQEMRFLDEMRRSMSRSARTKRRRERKEQFDFNMREVRRELEEARHKRMSKEEWNALEKRAVELVEDAERTSSAGEGSSGEEATRPVLRLRGG